MKYVKTYYDGENNFAIWKCKDWRCRTKLVYCNFYKDFNVINPPFYKWKKNFTEIEIMTEKQVFVELL